MSVLSETDVARPVPSAGEGRTRVTLALCFAAAVTEGFDISSMGVAAPRLGPALGLAREQLGPVFSASIFGLFVGALLIGRLADRVGRKWTLIASMAAFALFSAMTAFAHGFSDLFAIRVLAGLGLGGAMPNLIALAAEVTPERRRAMLVTVVASGMPFGGVVSGAVAAGGDWRWIFYVGGAAPLVLAAIMTPGLAESPDFLRARQARSVAGLPRSDFLWTLTGQGRALTTLLLWTSTFCALLTLYLLLNWLPTLMGAKGVSKHDASLMAVLFNLGGGLGVLILAALLERARRGLVVVGWYAGLIASLVALALVGPQFAPAGGASFFAGAFTGSVSIMLYGLAPGYYRVAIRATGVGATVAVGRLGAIFGPLFAAGLLTAGFGATGVLLALAPLATMAGAATLALLARPNDGSDAAA
jgi:AAHS family 3-hydroxyphenylpropionic acid transporter